MRLYPPNTHMPDPVTLIGLDFGSTTSSAMVATANVGLSCASGKMSFGPPTIIYRSEPVFTPFAGQLIDSIRLESYLDRWTAESRIDCHRIFAGGAIITGLAARRKNAAQIARIVRARFGQTIMATADDPCLESWLAFMGAAAPLSQRYPHMPVINLDIGGGTTNPAWGQNGQARRTGCYYIGARHFQFVPGAYRLVSLSDHAKILLNALNIDANEGDTLSASQIDAILNFYVGALEAMVNGQQHFFSSPPAKPMAQAPFVIDGLKSSAVLTFSGGVGELIYRAAQNKALPPTTFYGDLGIDLARRIVQSPVLSSHIHTHMPPNQGRATVYGLTLHSTEISGATLFISHPQRLPLSDIPIVARLPLSADDNRIAQALAWVQNSRRGACIQLQTQTRRQTPSGICMPATECLTDIKRFGSRLGNACAHAKMIDQQPLILLAPYNYGQALGNYVTNWRQSPLDLIVIDEIPDRQAHFVNIGHMRGQMAPVSFYGIYDTLESKDETLDPAGSNPYAAPAAG